jgi:hypothetical protein
MHSREPADASRPSAGHFSPAAFHGVFIMTIDKAGCAAIEASIRNLADNVPNSPNRDARDWAGFFAALAKLFVEVAPVIIPLFLNKEPETK